MPPASLAPTIPAHREVLLSQNPATLCLGQPGAGLPIIINRAGNAFLETWFAYGLCFNCFGRFAEYAGFTVIVHGLFLYLSIILSQGRIPIGAIPKVNAGWLHASQVQRSSGGRGNLSAQ